MDDTGVFRGEPNLLAAFRAGHAEALKRVYLAHVRPLERYLRGLARCRGAAELSQPSVIADLLQEVFSRAFSEDARWSYDGVRDYGGYLTGIARSCFIDFLRASGREVLTDPESLPFDPSEEPELESWRDPRVAAVLTSYLGDLLPALKAVYDQRFVLGHSQEEASAALGLSRRQLRTAEDRLRRGLRRALRRAGISLSDLRALPVARPAMFPLDLVKATGRARP